MTSRTVHPFPMTNCTRTESESGGGGKRKDGGGVVAMRALCTPEGGENYIGEGEVGGGTYF